MPASPHEKSAETSAAPAVGGGPPAQVSTGGGASLAARYPWAVFIVPFVVLLALGALEPGPEKPTNLWVTEIPYAAYPLVYTIKIALVMVAMAVLWPGYFQFPLRVSPLAPLVGAIGVVVWIGLCKLDIERNILGPLGLDRILDLGQRSSFNPLAHWPDNKALAYAFLAVRLWGLAAIVPLIEEFFLRGFVMRYFIQPDWWRVPFGTLNATAIAVGTLVPILLHPAEMVAAAVWFSMVTWLMWRTRNIWDCVVAHAVTNLLLGAWVVYSGEWHFL
jgi:CAAX prenyl protease-like protein